MIDAARTVRQSRETLTAHLQAFRATHARQRESSSRRSIAVTSGTRTLSSPMARRVFILRLTAFSLARDRENGDDNKTSPVSIDVPQMREDTASAWI